MYGVAWRRHARRNVSLFTGANVAWYAASRSVAGVEFIKVVRYRGVKPDGGSTYKCKQLPNTLTPNYKFVNLEVNNKFLSFMMNIMDLTS